MVHGYGSRQGGYKAEGSGGSSQGGEADAKLGQVDDDGRRRVPGLEDCRQGNGGRADLLCGCTQVYFTLPSSKVATALYSKRQSSGTWSWMCMREMYHVVWS